MELHDLHKREESAGDRKVYAAYAQFEKLLEELQKQTLTDELTNYINDTVDKINAFSGSSKDLRRLIRSSQSAIIRRLAKEMKIVPKNYYRNLWMAIGMSAFGIPMGIAFGTSLDNMAFIGLGLPIGLSIGLALGAGMDKKAQQEGRQLDLELG